MIVIDTNVVSQIVRGQSQIDDWLENQALETLAITTITIAEVAYGIARMPAGRRRLRLAEAWERIEPTLSGRVLGLGVIEAQAAGLAKAHRFSLGRPIADSDAFIAGICIAHRASLATRNTRDFDGLEIELINPWES